MSRDMISPARDYAADAARAARAAAFAAYYARKADARAEAAEQVAENDMSETCTCGQPSVCQCRYRPCSAVVCVDHYNAHGGLCEVCYDAIVEDPEPKEREEEE